ncbi:hypothetical protein [Umezawaea tangerina]|uniref:hypothetical protein n=1 Tax=Umezawaea tangerina TaxID=84725 RepID=UPI001FE55AF7|nr:hypothetical protein [Umezawaea tangerina]
MIGLAFLLSGLLILFLPMSSDTPSGSAVSCGNSIGMGFDPAEVEKIDPAFVGICGRLRSERLGWALPVVVGGAVLLVAGGLAGRRRSDA